MPLFFNILQTIAPLFVLILLGQALKRARILHSSHVPVMNGLVINVTMPALVIRGLVNSPPLPPGAAALPLALILAQFVTLGLAGLLGTALRMPRPVIGGLMLVGVFGNTGYLGYPITLAQRPHLLPEAILIDQFGMTILMFLLTPLIAARYGPGDRRDGRAALKKFFRGPIFVSLALGTLLRIIPWPTALLNFPAMHIAGRLADTCLRFLGQATVPLVLLALGVALRPGAVRSYRVPLAVTAILKLVVCPFAMLIACRLLHLHGDLRFVGLLQASMPNAVMASILAAENDLEGDYAISATFVSTIVSIFTIPLLLAHFG